MINKGHDIDHSSQAFRRHLIRQILQYVATHGLPGKHHFYMAFQSNRPDVKIPDFLREKYPDYIGIILQHQFDDLVVTEEAFEVTLSFQNMPARIHVPYTAILSFEDPSLKDSPSMRFEMHLTPEIPESVLSAVSSETAAEAATQAKPDASKTPDTKKAKRGEVVAFNKFRKK